MTFEFISSVFLLALKFSFHMMCLFDYVDSCEFFKLIVFKVVKLLYLHLGAWLYQLVPVLSENLYKVVGLHLIPSFYLVA